MNATDWDKQSKRQHQRDQNDTDWAKPSVDVDIARRNQTRLHGKQDYPCREADR